MGDIKTTGMKLSELRPCDFCGGAIVPLFHVIQIRPAAVMPGVRSTLGLVTMGFPLALAEVMSPEPEPIRVMEEPDAITELFCCTDCFTRDQNLAIAAEKVTDLQERQKAKKETDAEQDDQTLPEG